MDIKNQKLEQHDNNNDIKDQIINTVVEEFIKLGELTNSLLVNYIVHKEFVDNNIPHKFVLGFYNESSDNENKYSYTHVWIEHNDIIYDLANYINDKLIKVAPIDRINARYYNNDKNLYTNHPKWNRVDMIDKEDRDYDIIINKIFARLLVGNDDLYLNDMPKKYKSIIERISDKLN